MLYKETFSCTHQKLQISKSAAEGPSGVQAALLATDGCAPHGHLLPVQRDSQSQP